MALQIATIEKQSPLTMPSAEREARLLSKLRKRQINVLAVLPEQQEIAGVLQERLNLSEIVVCDSLDELMSRTSEKHPAGPVAAVIEIERPDRSIPIHEGVNGQVRSLDYVLGLGPESRLGRMDVSTTLGISAVALVSRAG